MSSSSAIPSSSSESVTPVQRIKLRRQLTEPEPDGMGRRMVVTAFDGEGIPNEIFLYEVRPGTIVPETGPISVCIGVARPADLADFGTTRPDQHPTLPLYYRRDTYDVVNRSPTVYEEVWNEIHTGVQELVDRLTALDNLDETMEVTVNPSPPQTIIEV